MLLIVALAAIILPLIMLGVLRVPAKYGMTISALVVLSLAVTVWQMESGAVAASIAQGIHRSLTILWILFGAMMLLNALKATGAMDRIKAGFYTVSRDMRVQAILIGLLFVSLLEGLAGFGAPVVIAAPLLVSLGFRPIAAVVIALIGDTIAVAFGAVGTPVLVGLSNVPSYNTPGFVETVAVRITQVDVLISLLLPLIMVIVLVFCFGETKKARSWRAVWEVAPWALFVGGLYAVCTISFASILTPEFVSIVSATVVLVIATIFAHRNILLQKDVRWRTHKVAAASKSQVQTMPLLLAWSPYIVVLIALLVSRLWGPVTGIVESLDFGWRSIFGYRAVSSLWTPLTSPGTILLLGAITAFIIRPAVLLHGGQPLKVTARSISISTLALVPTLIMVQIFINSGINQAGLASMPEYIALSLATIFGPSWILISPLLGMLGAFITGSSTVSTLTMAPIQYSIALDAGLPTKLTMAQQISGAAAGNMIAVHNVVAALTVVGLHHQEGRVIRRVLPVVVVYVALGICGALLLRWIGVV